MRNWLLCALIFGLLFSIVSCSYLDDFIGSSCQLKDCTMKEQNQCTHCDKHEVKDTCTNSSEKFPFKCNEMVYNFNALSCSILMEYLDTYESAYEILCQDDDSQECMILVKIKQLQEQNNSNSCKAETIVNLLFDIINFEFFESGQGDQSKNIAIRESDQKYTLISKSSTSKKCNCKEELYLYNNPIIEMEGVIVQATNESAPGGEGSLNYLIEPDGDYPNKFADPLINPGRIYPKINPIPDKIPIAKKPIVAFLDSGLDARLFPNNKYHLNRTNCMSSTYDSRGWNFIRDSNNTHDDVGHGTLVAASFKRLLNANQNYSVLPVKVLDECGYGTLYSTICGLYYASNSGADIINCSWGLYKDVGVMRSAIQEVSQHSFIVASAGNKGLDLMTNLHYPSEYSDLNSNGFRNVIEVAGLCHPYNGRESGEYLFWNNSNTNEKNIAESAIGYENLVDDLIKNGLGEPAKSCKVSGTSYAAPRITAALVNEWNINVSSTRVRFLDGLNNLNNCNIQQSYWSGQ
jgi:hypothetical protein